MSEVVFILIYFRSTRIQIKEKNCLNINSSGHDRQKRCLQLRAEKYFLYAKKEESISRGLICGSRGISRADGLIICESFFLARQSGKLLCSHFEEDLYFLMSI